MATLRNAAHDASRSNDRGTHWFRVVGRDRLADIGHERRRTGRAPSRSWKDAHGARRALVEMADGGAVFLDVSARGARGAGVPANLGDLSEEGSSFLTAQR